MADTSTKLGVALLLTLTSNATLLSLLLSLREPPSSSSSSSSASYSSSSSSSSMITDSAATTAAAEVKAPNSNAKAGENVPSWSFVLTRQLKFLSVQRAELGRNSKPYEQHSGESSSGHVHNFGFISKSLRDHDGEKSLQYNKPVQQFSFASSRHLRDVGGKMPPGTGGFSYKESSRGGMNEDMWREREVGLSSRRVRSTPLQRIDTGHHLEDVIASLSESDLKALDSSTVKILVPALVGLESMMLRELEKLHDASVHQELRLETLEKSYLQQQEIIDAANIIREEEYLLHRQRHRDTLRKQEAEENARQDLPPTPSTLKDATISVIDFNQGNNITSSDLQDGGDGSGSGAEPVIIAATAVSTPTPTSAVNNTENSENAIINHIYDIYSSLTSMEHKVVELGSNLGVVSSELYRQKSTLVILQDKVEEVRRQQRTLVMRTAMHGFKLADLEQFRGQAELLMLTTSRAVEQFEGKLEAFKDRVTEQQDEVQLMRNVFSRLEQSNNELRSADAYKAHDIQELKRGAQQVETRLNNLYHSLDRYMGNIRWDVKTYLDHVCTTNSLQC